MNEKTIEAKWPILHTPWRNVSANFKLAFFSACVIGTIVHIYIFTNLILNHDSVWRLFYDNDNLVVGRWFLQPLSDISTRFQMPVVIGIISIFMLALCAGITVKVLDVTNTINIILISGFIVSIPSVACIFSYMYTADAYFISLAFNALAVYLAKKYRFGWLPSIFLIALACGTYQAFICYAAGLFLFDCILRLLAGEPHNKVIKAGIKYVLTLMVGLLLYYAILNLLLLIKNVSLSSYQGINSMSLSNIKGFLSGIPLAYKKFNNYLFQSPYMTKFYQLMQTLCCAVFYGALIYLTIKRKLYKDKIRFLLLLLGVGLIPLALNLITVLSVGADVHALMIYSFVLQFVFTIKLAELSVQRMIQAESASWPFLHMVNIILCCFLLWNNFCISNMAYLRLQVCYENSYALANRVVTRIESLDGYSPELPVAIIGEASRKIYGNTVEEFSQINTLTGTADTLLFIPEPHLRTRKFIENYIGIRMRSLNTEQKLSLGNSEIVMGMPSYPAEGSVAMVDGVIVVKLSEGVVR